MFSGIIETIGEVVALRRQAAGTVLTIRSDLRGLGLGESIAVSGACMTVTRTRGRAFTLDVSAESLRRTTLGDLRVGSHVNLERSLRLRDRLSGHLVFGHVDGVGRVRSIRPEGEGALYRFTLPVALAAFLVEKGSIAVDGIRLTVAGIEDAVLAVTIVPHTYQSTTLRTHRAGDRLNLECDILAKYVEKLLGPSRETNPKLTLEKLRELGGRG